MGQLGPNEIKRVQMGQNGLNWSQNGLDGFKWFKLAQIETNDSDLAF